MCSALELFVSSLLPSRASLINGLMPSIKSTCPTGYRQRSGLSAASCQRLTNRLGMSVSSMESICGTGNSSRRGAKSPGSRATSPRICLLKRRRSNACRFPSLKVMQSVATSKSQEKRPRRDGMIPLIQVARIKAFLFTSYVVHTCGSF